jgi:hypothetical protein
LGYGRQEERFVRIVGLSRTIRQQLNAGQIVSAKAPEFMDDKTIRLIALIAGGVIMGFLLIVTLLKMLLH